MVDRVQNIQRVHDKTRRVLARPGLDPLHMSLTKHLTICLNDLLWFRNKRRTWLFCYYCAKVQRHDRLKDHCNSIHNDVAICLTSAKPPEKPAYENWHEYVNNYPDTEPIDIKGYEPYVNM